MSVREDGRCAACEGFIQQAGCHSCGSKRMSELKAELDDHQDIIAALDILAGEGYAETVERIKAYIISRETDMDWIKACLEGRKGVNRHNSEKLKEAVAEKIVAQNALLAIKHAVEDAEL